MISLTLDLPPSANRYWRHGNGNTYLSEQATAYREHVWFETRGMKALTGSVIVTAEFFFSTAAGDLDNRIKQLLDALQGQAYENDKQIVEIHAYRNQDKHRPRVEVDIEIAE